MKKSYILIILISFLVISPKLYAQVECPCNFNAVPKDTDCWEECDGCNGDPVFKPCTLEGCLDGDENSCLLFQFISQAPAAELGIFKADSGTLTCGVFNFDEESCLVSDQIEQPLSEAEFAACQCELAAYVTALNEGGITVSPDPPYECGNVDCRQKVLTPIPTLNEYGMIITAGVLGLLAVIGLFVIRRRKVSA